MSKDSKNSLAIDYGMSRIGLAKKFKDINTIVPLEQIHNDNLAVQKIIEIIQRDNIGLIFVGDPLALDGTKSQMCEKVDKFINALKKSCTKTIGTNEIEIKKVDERFTSAEINKRQASIGLSPKESKRTTDSLSATIILEMGLKTKDQNQKVG